MSTMDGLPENLSADGKQKRVTIVSPLFCDQVADLAFVSSDHVMFRIRRMHIYSNSAGFENIVIVNGSDTVRLSEHSDILEVLFQFVEPPPKSRGYRQPSVLNMTPRFFFAFAKAAEKYIVHSAMNTCLTRMQQLVSQHSLEILNHCAEHGYVSLADEAAQVALAQPLAEVTSKLTAPGVLLKYLIYYNKWREASDQAALMIEQKLPYGCHASACIYGLYLRQISRNPATFCDILPSQSPNIIPHCSCPNDPNRLCSCAKRSRPPPGKADLVTIRNGVPKFSAVTV